MKAETAIRTAFATFFALTLLIIWFLGVYLIVATVYNDYQQRQSQAEYDRQQWISEIERQCQLAWPLGGERYVECVEEQN